jgi:hypothetical protein
LPGSSEWPLKNENAALSLSIGDGNIQSQALEGASSPFAQAY